MADQKVPKTKKGPKQAEKSPRVLYTLTPVELEEYRHRHGFMMFKNTELMAASNYLEIYQNALIEEHGLPIIFDLNLEDGKVTERPIEEAGPNAENGRV